MKTRSLVLVAFLAAGLAVQAQDATGTPQTSAQPTAPSAKLTPLGLATELQLTPEQVKKLQEIDERHGQAFKELNREKLDQAARRQRTTEIRDRKQAEIKAVLTPEQSAQFEKLKQEHRDATMKSRKEAKEKPHNE